MKRAGFTLIELSIVLVIIGLIIGGVLVGQDLIRAAEIRNVVSQREKFDAAATTFRVKYGALPGDIHPATAAALGFFQLTGTCGGAYCSNFGNGVVDSYAGQMYEQLAFWRHLSEANLIPGTYGSNTGFGISADGASAVSITTPAIWKQYYPELPIRGYHWTVGQFMRMSNTNGAAQLFSQTGYTIYGSQSGTLYMTPILAYAIDAKIDDGKPNTGTVIDLGGSYDGMWDVTPSSAACTYGGADVYVADAQYNINPATGGNVKLCYLAIRASF